MNKIYSFCLACTNEEEIDFPSSLGFQKYERRNNYLLDEDTKNDLLQRTCEECKKNTVLFYVKDSKL